MLILSACFIKVRTYNVDQTKNLRCLNPEGGSLVVGIVHYDSYKGGDMGDDGDYDDSDNCN